MERPLDDQGKGGRHPVQDGRYARQEILRGIGGEGQERIRRARVLIVGCGALGGVAAEYLARAGVGSLRLVDRDCVEWSNLQRQIGFAEEDARRREPKAQALQRHLARVNSEVEIEAHAVDFSCENARVLARDVSLILDGTDNAGTRLLLNDLSLALRIPWIYCGAIEARAQVAVFSGERPPCLRCLLGEEPPPGSIPACETAGILGPAAGVGAAWQAALALRVLAQGGAGELAGTLVRLEPWENTSTTVTITPDPQCPACAAGRLDYLEGASGGGGVAVRLCGRRAVQVKPGRARGALDLSELAERLAKRGPVERLGAAVRWSEGDVTVTLFADGRAIIDGLTDLEEARSLYSRWIGA